MRQPWVNVRKIKGPDYDTGEPAVNAIIDKRQAPQSNDLQELQSEVEDHALAICQTFEAVEQWPKSPRGSLVTLYAGLAVSALFLPRDARHETWLRRKFAKLETMG